jgi:alpha-aminoadipic semialdehyde synthase
MQSFKSLGMLELKKTIYLHHWTSFVQQCIALQHKDTVDPTKDALSSVGTLIPPERMEPLHQALEWLSLIPPVIASASPIPVPALPASPMAPIDIFAYLLAYKLRYKPHERDMVVMSHEIIARPRQEQRQKKGQEQVYKSSLIAYGTSRASAMARTVGLPVAIAALHVLDGKVNARGVVRPDDPSVYGLVLRGLEEVGLGMEESVLGGEIDSLESKLIKSFRW